jgi:imidazolonepropionase-like amidohydrolase
MRWVSRVRLAAPSDYAEAQGFEVERGMLADLIALRGNTLEDVTVLEDVPFVMIDGRVVKSAETEGGSPE